MPAHQFPLRRPLAYAGCCVLLFAGAASVAVASDAEAAFLKENDAAMVKMHREMHVAPTGDVDHDFAAMMIPHHRGAIEMAQAVLRHGRDPQMRRLAQEIIVEQQQEIGVMRKLLNQPPTAANRRR